MPVKHIVGEILRRNKSHTGQYNQQHNTGHYDVDERQRKNAFENAKFS